MGAPWAIGLATCLGPQGRGKGAHGVIPFAVAYKNQVSKLMVLTSEASLKVHEGIIDSHATAQVQDAAAALASPFRALNCEQMLSYRPRKIRNCFEGVALVRKDAPRDAQVSASEGQVGAAPLRHSERECRVSSEG
jgi:hypothetical protein